MLTAELPPDLARAVELRLQAADAGALGRAVAELSRRYRAGGGAAPVARSAADVLAYAAYRLPATYAAAAAAAGQLRERVDGWRPASLLDLGSGPGAAAWAAVATWPSIERVTAVDAVPEMVALARALAAHAEHPALRAAAFEPGDLAAPRELPPHDLVVLSYALGELPADARDALLRRAWAAARGAVLVVEPGTPAGYRAVIAARRTLLAAGARTVGPCPHDAACPMGGGDWCHFAVRLPRSAAHRLAKGAALGHEDEKFSWVAVSAAPTDAEPRILRHPQVRGGHVRLELCTESGLRSVVVSKRDGDLFRRGRKASWGETFPAAPETDEGRSGLEEGPPTAPG